jgi:uncharacterized protein YdcH (DUF465 family)
MTKLIEKYKELNHVLSEMAGWASSVTNTYMMNLRDHRKKLESEIAELEKQAITDADIEAWCDTEIYDAHDFSENWYYSDVVNAVLKCAKAMRDNEIKHIEK